MKVTILVSTIDSGLVTTTGIIKVTMLVTMLEIILALTAEII